MPPRRRRALIAIALPGFFIGLTSWAAARADETALRPTNVTTPATRSRAELAEFVRGTLDRTPTASPPPLQTDRANLLAAFRRQEEFLARSRQHGTAWQKHLRSHELATELAKPDGGDLASLDALLRSYESGHAGLELKQFRDVHDALAQYNRSVRAARLADSSHEYQHQLLHLAETLERQRLRSRSYQEIASALAWLEQHGFAPEVVAAVRGEFVQPNLLAHVSGDTICSQLNRQIDERLTINNMINGARVTGRGHLTGNVTFELVPHHERAAIRMRVDGKMDARTTARSGPVGLAGIGSTRLTGEKLILADGDIIHSLPATVSAETHLQPTGVWSTFRGPVLDRLARRISWQRNLESKPSSERTVSRRAEHDLRQRMDAEAATLVASLQQAYVDELRVPFSKHQIFPQQVRLSTTREHLRLDATLVAPGQLAAMTPPPELDPSSLVSVAIHESFFNNLTDTALSGRTLQSTELAKVLEKLLGETPFGFETVDGVPWELTVAEGTPLDIRLADGGVTVTISCQKIVAGPEMFDVPFAVSAKYLAAIEGDAVVFRRQGGLGVAGPALGGIGKLSDGVTDSTAVIAERFEMLLQEELRFTADQMPFPLPVEGKLVPTRLDLRDGWLHLALDTELATPPTAIATGGRP